MRSTSSFYVSLWETKVVPKSFSETHTEIKALLAPYQVLDCMCISS